MALAKFSEWVEFYENDENQPESAQLPPELEAKRDTAQLGQFEQMFNRLISKMDDTKAINKQRLMAMLGRFIEAVEKKSTSLGGQVRTGIARLGKALDTAGGNPS